MATQLSKYISRRVRILILTVMLAGLFLAAADFVHRQIATTFKHQSVAALAESTLARAEIATDYAVISLGELYEKGHVDCGTEAMVALNDAVFRSGSITDILTARNGSVCSVATHSQTLTRNYFSPVDGLQARNSSIVLNPLRLDGTPALAVSWFFDETTSAAALVNTEAMFFDVLPPVLRENGAVRLSLNNGRTIGKFEGTRWEIGGATEMFEVRSQRYPFTVRIHVPIVLLEALNAQRNPATLAVESVLAIVLAYLIARGLMSPYNISSRIGSALSRGEIVPHFQPIYDIESGEMTGFEVLARWPQPDGSFVSPSVFVPMIETGGHSDLLLEKLVFQTAEAMGDLIEEAPNLTFSFNASPSQAVDEAFANRFANLLRRARLEPSCVVIEITEREEIGDVRTARRRIEALRVNGVLIAIDDAGTGHNGLVAIQGLGAAILKIDKFFVDGIELDPRAGTMVRMLVSMAREYGMKVVAEGVETGEQLSALSKIGVDAVQGYFLSRPLDADAAKSEYARHQAILLGTRMSGSEPGAAQADMPEREAISA